MARLLFRLIAAAVAIPIGRAVTKATQQAWLTARPDDPVKDPKRAGRPDLGRPHRPRHRRRAVGVDQGRRRRVASHYRHATAPAQGQGIEEGQVRGPNHSRLSAMPSKMSCSLAMI
jgi:hypothetical protein